MSVNITQQSGYGLGQVGSPIYGASLPPIVTTRNPGVTDYAPIGSFWVNTSNNTTYFLTSLSAGVATWSGGTGGAGAFATLSSVTTTIVGTTLTVGTNATIGGTLGVTGATTLAAATIVGALTQTGGVAGIGTDATTNAINLGTGAAAKVLTIGNSSGTTSIALNTGTGNSLNLGTNAIAHVITIGNIIGATAVNVNTGTAGTTYTTTNGIFTLNTGTGVVTISGDAHNTTINIGTGAGVKTGHLFDSAQANVVTLGSTTGAAATTIQAGTVGLALSAAGLVSIVTSTDTQASPTAASTKNFNIIRVIFTGFTTASAATQAFTINSTKILINSAVLVGVTTTTSTNAAEMTVTGVTQTVGTLVVNCTNNGAGALDAVLDTVVVTVWIMS